LGVDQFTLNDVRALTGGSTRHLVRMLSKQIQQLPEAISVNTQRGDKASITFDTDGCDVCNTILAHSSFLISGSSVSDSTILYSFVTPSYKAFQAIISALEAKGLKPRILEVTRFRPKGKVLTERQEWVLWLALNLGFFEYPRKINTLELSRKFGIVPSTLSEITRRGIRRVLEDYFET
jgi:predicted DNA binding protein